MHQLTHQPVILGRLAAQSHSSIKLKRPLQQLWSDFLKIYFFVELIALSIRVFMLCIAIFAKTPFIPVSLPIDTILKVVA